MLISYPLLPGRTSTAGKPETDSAYETRLLSYEDNSFAKEHELFDEGVYPVSFDGRWHGGIHMKPATNTEPIRAIADGEVVAYRYADKPLFTHDDAQKTRECDNSFVLLKHKTETGEGVVVEYYSLYMHLANAESNTKQLPAGAAFNQTNNSADFIRKGKAAAADSKALAPAAADKKVYRKQILGYAGQMYGEQMFHFEVFTDEAKLNAFFKDSKVDYVDAKKDGSKELWGDVYFVIPEKTKHLKQPDIADAATKAKYTVRTEGENEKKLYVGWNYTKGQRKMTVWEDGNPEPIAKNIAVPNETNYEYDLFELAKKRFDTCPSAGYELLRWGRMLGPDKDKLNTDALKANWQPMPYKLVGDVASWGYLNVSDSKILKLSDADFPHWLGWKKVPSATKPDGTVDVAALQEIFKEIDTNDDKTLTDVELKAWLANAKAKNKFKHLIVQSPSEWDKTHNEARYGGLKAVGKVFDAAKDVGGINYGEFKKFIEKFQWWAESGLADSGEVWHFHPIKFIQHFSACGWLSERETIRLVNRSKAKIDAEPTWAQVKERLSDAADRRPAGLQLSLQKMIRKYLGQDLQRIAHLFGQLAAETGRFEFMVELGKDSYFDKYEPGTDQGKKLGNTEVGDGKRFKGRGLIQITGRDNYTNYGNFRDAEFLTDANAKTLATDPYKTCDASGFYWASKQRYKIVKVKGKDKFVELGDLSINSWADKGNSVEDRRQVTKCINPGLVHFDDVRSPSFAHAFYVINDATSVPTEYLPIKEP